MRELFGLSDSLAQPVVESAAFSDDLQADIVLVQAARLSFEGGPEQPHECLHLSSRAPPVLA